MFMSVASFSSARPWHLVLAALVAGLPSVTQAAGKSGEQVYQQVCIACHAADRADAPKESPKFGDRKVWAPLIKEGQPVLTGHAWVGVRGMPAQGGQPDLTLPEFASAVAYMARAAGGKWRDPDAAMLKRIEHEVEKRRESLQYRNAK